MMKTLLVSESNQGLLRRVSRAIVRERRFASVPFVGFTQRLIVDQVGGGVRLNLGLKTQNGGILLGILRGC